MIFSAQFMRISLLITIISLNLSGMLLAAPARGQDISTIQVILNIRHENLESAIKRIEAQTSLHFYYREADIKGLGNLNIDGQYTVEKVLQQLLANSFLTFRQVDNAIFIERKPQENYQITGRVIDDRKQPVAFATVSLYKAQAMIQAVQTDTSGHFMFSVKEAGNYLLKLSSVGMDSLSIAVTLADQRSVTLPDLMLSASAKELKQVNVVSSRPLIEQKTDRTIVNVDALLSASGMTALDVLQKSPGVQVDPNSGISLKGKAGVIVLIDDRPTYLTGEGLTNYLKSLPASTLDQLEIMTNPPAKYDAAGNAGVINIRVKKSKAKGFNGAFNLAYLQSDHAHTNNSFNFNYRNDKVNLFGNLSYGIDNVDQNLTINRAYLNPDGSVLTAFSQDTHFNGVAHSTGVRVGMDYYASEKNIFGFVLNGTLAPNHHSYLNNGSFTGGSGALDSTLLSNNHDQGHFNNGGANLNFRHAFDPNGTELVIDLDYLDYSTAKSQQFTNMTYLPDGAPLSQEILNGDLPDEIHIYSAKTDYTQNLPAAVKLSAGLKTSYTNTDNTADYISSITGGPLLPDYGLSNHFLYRENINAVYISLNKDYKRISIQAGLRLEHTEMNGHQLGNPAQPDSSFKRNYTDLFPTVYLAYKLDTAGRNVLYINYGRRVDRPFYQDLNPFTTTVDRYTYYVGNPFLNPSFTNKVELGANLFGHINASLSYNKTYGDIDETIQILNGIFYSRPANVGVTTVIGGSLDVGYDLSKWLSFHFYGEMMNDAYKTDLPTGELNTQGTYFYLDPLLQFKLSPTWTTQVDGFYRNRVVSAQFDLVRRGEANISISKKVSQNLTLKLTVNDFTKSYVNSGIITNIGDNRASYRNIIDTRVAIFSLSYRFGKAISNLKQHETNGAQEEQNRVKQ